MPRRARLDVPDVLQHVMARGIEGRDIFGGTRGREAFLKRLSGLVTRGNIQLLAWCLMPNHFHLLLRTREMSLSSLMRRLLTGHAVWFNRRHDREGHLFQNRYKSIIVEEEPYFLELVRYIHLNPVRAKMLESIAQLDKYPYTGHAVLMGNQQFEVQDVGWVLDLFGRGKAIARKGYRDFVEAKFNQGTREDLQGGGLDRSTGGREQIASGSNDASEKVDERVLGRGDFVEAILRLQRPHRENVDFKLGTLLDGVCKEWKVARDQILGRSRGRQVSRARRMFFLRALEESGASLTGLGRICGMTASSVSEAVEKARLERGKP